MSLRILRNYKAYASKLRFILQSRLVWAKEAIVRLKVFKACCGDYLERKSVYSAERFLPWLLMLSSLTWIVCSSHFKLSAPPVGVYIAILAAVAGIATFYPPAATAKWDRVAWITVIAILMFLEVRNLYQDRDEHNKQQLLISKSLGEQGQTLQGMAQNIHLSFSSISGSQSLLSKKLTNLKTQNGLGKSKVAEPQAPTEIVVSQPYGNLRERAINLSQQLYSLTSAEQQEVQAAIAKAGPSKSAEIAAYQTNKLSWEYSSSYEDQVKQIHDDFTRLNLRDPGLEETLSEIEHNEKTNKKYNGPMQWNVNGAMVLSIARSLTELASKIQ